MASLASFLLCSIFFFQISLGQEEDELLLVQFFHRHGAKIPDVIDPANAEIWEQFNLDAGFLSPLGETQFRTLGSMFRQRYVYDEQLLPEEYNQDTMYIRASTFNSRPIQSSQSFVQTLYPGAPVFIYTVDPALDTLLLNAWTCPSWRASVEEMSARMVAHVFARYNDVMRNISALTSYNEALYPDTNWEEYCTVSECPQAFVLLSLDGIQLTIQHGFQDTLSPYFTAPGRDILFNDILTDVEAYPYVMFDENDPRGPGMAELINEVLQNIQSRVEGTSPRRFINYSFHSICMIQLMDALGIPTRFTECGDGIVLELRRRAADGEYYLKAEYLHPNFGGESYESRELPLRCPTLQDECNLNDFSVFLSQRNPVPPQNGGCCLRTEAFYDVGCGDFLNPDVLNIRECLVWRQFCPQTSCGDGQILHASTLLCMTIGTSQEK